MRDITGSPMSRRVLAGLLVLILLAGTAAVASAAMTGQFDAQFSGYAEDTDEQSNAIQVEGELEVVGDSAVNPRILVQSGDHTVLDTSSIEVFVAGDTSVNFEEEFGPGEVRYTTDELPPNTRIQIEYTVYYTGGVDAEEITAGQVQGLFSPPGGDVQRETFAAQVSTENSPDARIDQLEQEVSAAESGADGGFGLVVVVGIAVVALILGAGAVYAVMRDTGPPGTGGGPPGT